MLGGLLEYHQDETAAQKTAQDYLEAAERLVEVYRAFEGQVEQQGLPVARLDAWPNWREVAEMLAATGEAILADEEKYGTYLDAMTLGRSRARLTVRQLRNRLSENRALAATPEVQQPRHEPAPRQQEGFAHTLDEPRKPRTRAGRTDEVQQQGFAHALDRPPAEPPAPSEKEKGFAYILDDPEELRKLRERTEKRDRKLGRHLRRSRGLSM